MNLKLECLRDSVMPSFMKNFLQCWEKLAFLQSMVVFEQIWPLFIAYGEIFLQGKNSFLFQEKSVSEKIPSKNFFFFTKVSFYHSYILSKFK